MNGASILNCVDPQIGPRMTLQLLKIQEGMGEGNVLYHSMGECTLVYWSLCCMDSGVHDENCLYDSYDSFLKVNAC